jgi:hypothetical protein
MATQPHTEQPSLSTPEHKEGEDASHYNMKTEIALGELDSFLIAALCVVREEESADMDKNDKADTLEVLIRHARSALFDAHDGHIGVWKASLRQNEEATKAPQAKKTPQARKAGKF